MLSLLFTILYDLVCRKIFCFWVKSILGNYETALYSYFLPGDIDRYGFWVDCMYIAFPLLIVGGIIALATSHS